MTIQQIEDAEYHYDDFKVYPYCPESTPGNWSRHFARIIRETLKRMKNKDSNAAVLRISYG